MSDLLAPDSEGFNLFLEYLKSRQNEIRSMMPTATDGIAKLQHQWALLEELTKDDGADLRLRLRQFWHSNAPQRPKPFDE